MARDMETLDLVSRLADGHRGFELLKKEALKKVEKNEESVSRLVFRTRAELPMEEIEYSRGFRQGVMYVIHGLPNEIKAEFKRKLKEGEQ